MNSKTILAQLVNGGFVVGKEATDFLTDVVQAFITDDGTGTPNVQIAPMMYPFNVEMTGMHVKWKDVVCQMDCPPMLEKSYLKSLEPVSNLVMASEIPENLKAKSKLKLV